MAAWIVAEHTRKDGGPPQIVKAQPTNQGKSAASHAVGRCSTQYRAGARPLDEPIQRGPTRCLPKAKHTGPTKVLVGIRRRRIYRRAA